MDRDCSNCINIKNLTTRMEKVEKIVDEKGDMFEIRITKLERRGDVTDQKFLQVFEKLDEIINILRERDKRLPTLMYSVGGMVLGGTLTGVLVWLITK